MSAGLGMSAMLGKNAVLDVPRFARHEMRLGLRDLTAMLRGGIRGRLAAAAGILTLTVLLHAVAWAILGRGGTPIGDPDRRTLVVVTTLVSFSACLFLSQAIESVTRVLYGRGDLDLILSSPVSVRPVLIVRVAGAGLWIGATTFFVAGPFANVLAWTGGARWLGLYPTAIGISLAMTALAVVVALGLLRLLGPARTRLAAQIAAAVIGSAFAIGLQIGAIAQYGELSRFTLVASDAVLAWAPAAGSPLWWPARGATGEFGFALLVLAGGLASLAVTLALCAGSLERAAYATTGLAVATGRSHRGRGFRVSGPSAALRRKEWRLLVRDPWLVSQSLMQILYLVPPAVMLWHSYGEGAGKLAVLVPILVMTAGQLAGSLAWLAISGEDAPDLVATAPVSPGRLVRAKLGAVLAMVGCVFAPFVLALATASPATALVAAGGAALAAASAFLIQFRFRQRGRRSQFRRRQTASRVATFAEAFSSIAWAGVAGLVASLPPSLGG